jgi:hypothetical protein
MSCFDFSKRTSFRWFCLDEELLLEAARFGLAIFSQTFAQTRQSYGADERALSGRKAARRTAVRPVAAPGGLGAVGNGDLGAAQMVLGASMKIGS